MTQLLKANPPNQPELFVDGLKMANGLDLDSEYNAYVTETSHDNYGGEILRFDMTGRQTLRIGNLRRPLDVAVDDSLSIYVTDTDRHLVRKFNRRGKELLDFGGFGTTPGKMAYPSGIALEPNGYIWISDTGNGRVQLFDPLGNRLYDFELPSSNSRGEAEPLDLDLRGSSSIYVVDKLSQWILHLVKPPLVDPNMQLAAHAQSSEPRLLIRNPINIPNPFNPSKEKTVLRFSTTRDGRARILIYDLAGRPVRAFDFFCTEGSNEAAWDGRNEVGVTADNGVYYFKIVVESAGESAAAFGKIAVLR